MTTYCYFVINDWYFILFLTEIVQNANESTFAFHEIFTVTLWMQLCSSDDSVLSQTTISAVTNQILIACKLLKQLANSFISPPLSVKFWKNEQHSLRLYVYLCNHSCIRSLVWNYPSHSICSYCCSLFSNTEWHYRIK